MKYTFKSVISLLLCLFLLSVTVMTACDRGNSAESIITTAAEAETESGMVTETDTDTNTDIETDPETEINKETETEVETACMDENCDHECDSCGIILSDCTDADNDNSCDACEKCMPGLYDADENLLASWSELVDTYGMDVTKNYTSYNYSIATTSPYYVLTQNEALFSARKIVVSHSITSIGDHAFRACSNLTSINLPDGVTSMGSYAFFDCSGLTDVNIPNGLTSIDFAAFGNCSGLASIQIPAGVMSIGRNAFYNCSGLTSVTFAEGSQCTSIDNSAFLIVQALPASISPHALRILVTMRLTVALIL